MAKFEWSFKGGAARARACGVVTEACAGLGGTTAALLGRFRWLRAVELERRRWGLLVHNMRVICGQEGDGDDEGEGEGEEGGGGAAAGARAVASAQDSCDGLGATTGVEATAVVGGARLLCGDFTALLASLFPQRAAAAANADVAEKQATVETEAEAEAEAEPESAAVLAKTGTGEAAAENAVRMHTTEHCVVLDPPWRAAGSNGFRKEGGVTAADIRLGALPLMGLLRALRRCYVRWVVCKLPASFCVGQLGDEIEAAGVGAVQRSVTVQGHTAVLTVELTDRAGSSSG